MQPDVIQLKSIIKNKAAIFRELKKYIKPIEEIAKDSGLAIYKQEQEHIILKEHLFGKETGLLPLIERLIEINSLILAYDKPTHLGPAAMNHYNEMLKRVGKEQDFLVNYFRKTLMDVSLHKRYKEYWDESFPLYQSFLNTLKLDLIYFNLALKTYAKTTLYWIINLIQMRRIDEAIDFVQNREDAKLLSEAEADFFDKLLKAIKDAKYWDMGKILEDGKELLEEDEFNLLSYVLDKIKDELYREIKQEEPQVDDELEKLVQRLKLEEEELKLVEKTAEEEMPEIIPKIEEKAGEIEEIIDLIEEIAPEVKPVRRMTINLIKGMTEKGKEAIPSKRFKKSRLRRLRARFRLAKRKLKGSYKGKKEALGKGMMVLKKCPDIWEKIGYIIKSKLIKVKKDLEEVEQGISSRLAKIGAYDLKPTKVAGRKVWVPGKSEIHGFLEKEYFNVKQKKEQTEKVIGEFYSEQYKKGKGLGKKTVEYAVETLKGIKNYKAGLQGRLAKIDIKRSSQKFIISAMLVPLLIGIFPSKIDRGKMTSSLPRPKSVQEILSQLNLNVQDPATQKMFEASKFVDVLVNLMNRNKTGDIKNQNLPDYIKELISDGVLDIAVFVGAEFEYLPIKKDEIRVLPESMLILRIRYINNIKDAKKAFEECDVIHIESHSRFGLGWALAKEGMANPLKMQPAPIKIPKKELYGYKGQVLKDLRNGHVIVQGSDEDIKQVKGRRGYQLISMNSCDSGKHFLEVIKRLREGLPTTVIYTTTEVKADTAEILLRGLSSGKSILQITQEMNDEEKKERLKEKGVMGVGNRYEAVVLNAGASSPESTAYERHNIPNSVTLFYGLEPQPVTEDIDLRFSPAKIQEVNKTVYTEGSYKNSKYVVVMPHSTELNALDAARAAAKGPITYVAGNNDRNLKIKTNEGTFELDPNRVFCKLGISDCFKFLHGKNLNSLKKENQGYIITAIKKFTDEISNRIFVGKMVLALHQNTKGNWGIRSYRDDPEYSKHTAEINVDESESNDVVVYVNTKGWFSVLKAKGWNVVLQKNNDDIDDGSLSYAATWRNLPYVNIEVQTGDASKQAQMISVINDLIDKYPLLANDMNFVPP